jgi:hypothetical protein
VRSCYQRAEEHLKFAHSYNRADRIIDLFVCRHPERIRLLGKEWSGCDAYPKEMRILLLGLPCPAVEAMTREEREHLDALPEIIHLWRGCYEHNRDGFSWSEVRSIAKRHLTLSRYRHDGSHPLLLHGTVNRRDIIFVKHDRKEHEIVPRPGTVAIVETLRI